MAALSIAIAAAQKQRASRDNRQRQLRAERRITEIVKVSGIADEYGKVDRKGDLRIETAFARLYHAAPSEELRTLIVDAYVAWQVDERAEEQAVVGQTGMAVAYMKDGNPIWLDGAAVPTGSDGAA